MSLANAAAPAAIALRNRRRSTGWSGEPQKLSRRPAIESAPVMDQRIMESMIEPELPARQQRPDQVSGGLDGAVGPAVEEGLEEGDLLLVGRA